MIITNNLNNIKIVVQVSFQFNLLNLVYLRTDFGHADLVHLMEIKCNFPWCPNIVLSGIVPIIPNTSPNKAKTTHFIPKLGLGNATL